MPDPLDPETAPAPPVQLPPAAHPIKVFIIEWGAVMGVPSALLAVVCPALGASATTTAIVTVAVCTMLGVGLVFAWVRRALGRLKGLLARIPVAVPWIGILILVTTNVYVQVHPPKDQWQIWQREIFAMLDRCRDVPDTADACMTRALATRQHPAMERSGSDPRADLASDLRGGGVLLQHPQLKERLRTWLGVDERFLGIGLSQPHGSPDYSRARVAEVLIPNFTDTNEGIWSWELEPVATNLGRIVGDVIYNSDPMQAKADWKQREFALFREEIRSRIATFNDSVPPVIRFAQITRAQYSGCLGRRERLRVFASRLGPVIDMKLGDAAQFSGYSLKPDAGSGVKLFVMVFVPSHPDQVVSATWREILSRLDGWVRDPKTCQ